jgi:hypothetical protein
MESPQQREEAGMDTTLEERVVAFATTLRTYDTPLLVPPADAQGLGAALSQLMALQRELVVRATQLQEDYDILLERLTLQQVIERFEQENSQLPAQLDRVWYSPEEGEA